MTNAIKLYDGPNAVFSSRLTEGENSLLQHVTMWGSSGYPISKQGRGWVWRDAFGVKGSPTVYRTKRAAFAAFQLWIELVLDYRAGRIERCAS